MHTSVRNYFIKFNVPIEGRVTHMYLDINGLVTIGVGNLIDVETGSADKILTEIKALPFVLKKGANIGKPASPADIEAEWKLVKGTQEWKNHKASQFAGITNLELQEEAIIALALKKADVMEKELKHHAAFRDFDQWPADAQLGVLSMAWALGTTKLRNGWPSFNAACQKQDFDAAVKQCEISAVGNSILELRNDENKKLFNNAAAVRASDGKNLAENIQQRRTLYYPRTLLKKIT